MNGYAVSLLVFSAVHDAAEITRRLGVEPTETARKDDPLEDGERLSHHMWVFDLDGATEGADFATAAESIIARFRGRESALRELAADGEVQLYCGCFLADALAQVQLAPEHVAWLAASGARFKWTVYRVEDEVAAAEPAVGGPKPKPGAAGSGGQAVGD